MYYIINGLRTEIKKLEDRINAHFEYPNEFSDWQYLTQLNQARAIEFAIDLFRSQRPICMGTLYWQFNDCWPVISWSAVDGYGAKKPLWYATRNFYSDRRLIIRSMEDGFYLFADNDSDETWLDEAKFFRYNLQNDLLAKDVYHFIIPPRSCEIVCRLADIISNPVDPTNEYIAVRSRESSAEQFFQPDKFLKYSEPEFQTHLIREQDLYHLTIKAQSLMRDVILYADHLDPQIECSDQKFTLIPDESKTITFNSKKNISIDSLTTRPILMCANFFGNLIEKKQKLKPVYVAGNYKVHTTRARLNHIKQKDIFKSHLYAKEFDIVVPEIESKELMIELDLIEETFGRRGSRLFSIFHNETVVAEEIDANEIAGGRRKATTQKYKIEHAGGDLNLNFKAVKNDAMFSAFRVFDGEEKIAECKALDFKNRGRFVKEKNFLGRFVDQPKSFELSGKYDTAIDDPYFRIKNVQEPDIFRAHTYADELNIKTEIEAGWTRIELDFCETFYKKNGERVFDVFLNDKKIISNLDVHKSTKGSKKPITYFYEFDHKGGEFNLKFKATKDHAMFSAVRAIRYGELLANIESKELHEKNLKDEK